MDRQDITDAQMEAEFQERNKNLKQSLNSIVDKIDHFAQSTHHFLEANIDTSNHTTLSSIVNDRSVSAFEASGNPRYNRTTYSPHNNSRRPSLIREQQSSNLDRKLMNSINDDIVAMHSVDPELFESVASKIDETFGGNALI